LVIVPFDTALDERLSPLWEDRVVAVVRAESVPDPVGLCEALGRGGIRTVEFTFTISNIEKCLEAAVTAAEGKDMIVGAGTVLTAEQARRAIDLGVRFFVTPCHHPDVAEMASDHGIPLLDGAFTPGEVHAAHRHGAAAVKIFPAGAVGPTYLKDLHGPFPDVALVPSGGIDASNARTYLDNGAAAVTAGTSVVSPALVAASRLDEIESRAAQFVTSLGPAS
jgi:2-dehydro-3-deoxyphosphogluconate aldolase / (4S)-4-hydroxy-2-oxoglutarate aldolase